MAENIYLFVPNIIDYGRLILAFVSFYFMPFDPAKASVCYIISGLLDAFDGHFARMLNQGSRFGAMMDQLTDRITTMCLCATLCHLYPSYMFFFQVSMALDIFSHWMHLQGDLLDLFLVASSGALGFDDRPHLGWSLAYLFAIPQGIQRLLRSALTGSDSHKKIDLAANPLLRHYYGNRIVLFLMCLCNEAFFCAVYLCYFTPGPIIPILGVGLFKLTAVVCCPLSLLKQFISVIQLLAACENFVIVDREERAAAAKLAAKNK